MKHSNKTMDFVKKVNEQLLEIMSQALTSDVEVGWISAAPDGKLPHNAKSGRTYELFNSIGLSIEQIKRKLPYSGWLTFLQIQALGGKVVKGSRAQEVLFRDFMWIDENRNKVPKEQVQDRLKRGDDLTKIWYLKIYKVFNLADTEGLPESFYDLPPVVQLTEPEKNDRAEEFLRSTGATIKFLKQDRAYYNRVTDLIVLPSREQFVDGYYMYTTAFHELGHWTGAPHRLDRTKGKRFGDKDYAFEELVAELYACYAAHSLGIELKMTGHAEYLKSWMRSLKDDDQFFFQASGLASKALHYTQELILSNPSMSQAQ